MEDEKDFYEEFVTVWNKLSERNKQHVRNGLGDNLIQTEEQAKYVIAIMKAMLVFQLMDKDETKGDNDA